jgi:hypothetical protein
MQAVVAPVNVPDRDARQGVDNVHERDLVGKPRKKTAVAHAIAVFVVMRPIRTSVVPSDASPGTNVTAW